MGSERSNEDTGESDKNIRPVAIENDKLFEFLKPFQETTKNDN